MSPSRTHASRRPAVGARPPHAVHVLGGGVAADGPHAPSARTAAHARALARGLTARGVRVTVCTRHDAALRHSFTGTGAEFTALPGRTEADAVARLRAVCTEADLVHAHGLRAGLLAALALGRRRSPVPLVVTWYALPRAGPGPGHASRADAAHDLVTRLLLRRVARAATVVLGTTTELVDAARRSGARDARLAPAPVPLTGAGPSSDREDAAAEEALRSTARAGVGAADRPLLVAVGRLDGRRGHDTALTASRAWRGLSPAPLLAVAGEGPGRGALQRRIDEEKLPVRLLGRRDDALRLLAEADIALQPTRCRGPSLVAQEALRAGVPLVAAASGGVPELVGTAAVLVPCGDADSLASAVLGLLADPARRAALGAAGRAQARTWPGEDATAALVLGVYDEVTRAVADR
ncbi:glycosyltransferase family 4 protein [Streptomyces qinglanensis]|uniref:Glycosyltransferase involved in cell wall bisynthesis n=1 Tax=Streptomyces qinglanensis TaxID=943816 RepID=A0A1H9T5Z6_9ACTN|nr:glycosyltransferase family 4 protein [Streptomyces qinglanensis]SER92578.1 Glycosyltransferase involved in cell wall bisynthesis [Streptomyces qinglanensis]